MTIELKQKPDAVLTELWAIKDRRAELFGDLDHLIEHLRARERNAQSNPPSTVNEKPSSRSVGRAP
ncbi:MAG TPA: hypothetical protein PKN64_13675 [Casimicrobium sp.]|jgi:hypothetical protein|nr:hypothetical protein [Casimicrobium sp.]